MPKWMAGIDTLAPARRSGSVRCLAAGNPKNLVLIVGAAAGLAQLGVSTGSAVAAVVVFVVVGSLSVAGPVVYSFVGGEGAKATLMELQGWLGEHNVAVMTTLLLVFGVVLIANGLPPLTD